MNRYPIWKYAIILVALYALIHLSNRDTISLVSLLATTGFAFAFVRYQQGHFTLPSFRLPRRQPKFQVLPGGREQSRGSSSTGKTHASAPRPVRDTTTALLERFATRAPANGAEVLAVFSELTGAR